MSDYIPSNDADMNLWQGNLIEIVETNLISWGISAEDFAVVKAKQTHWTNCFAKASNKQNRTAADVKARDDAGVDFRKTIRGFVAQWLGYNTKVTDTDRTRMGITVKSGTRTAVPVPTSSPVGNIDFSVRLQHTIHFYDDATARSKAKPEGVHGCEIYMKVDGDAPKDISELNYVVTDTATPYVVKFDGSKAGKMVYYWLRWVNKRGECGPWSITLNALVMG